MTPSPAAPAAPPLAWTTVPSPLGPLRLIAQGEALVALGMDPPAEPPPGAEERLAHPVLAAAAAQLQEYFAGTRRAFELPLAPQGTEFQRRVWAALQEIPYGETITYGALSRALGDPLATRAVGLANGRNPIGLIIPCHRVIGQRGALTGYAGGVARKRWLLDHESRVAGRAPVLPWG
ncbi:methylated-DNA--[protein]-cysteine S-methyltransferase [Myxococcota bacterium]|nr:methylated-DNA--[protein]-cysteine S-methyltransferase [Myxococcota bacterium]